MINVNVPLYKNNEMLICNISSRTPKNLFTKNNQKKNLLNLFIFSGSKSPSTDPKDLTTAQSTMSGHKSSY